MAGHTNDDGDSQFHQPAPHRWPAASRLLPDAWLWPLVIVVIVLCAAAAGLALRIL